MITAATDQASAAILARIQAISRHFIWSSLARSARIAVFSVVVLSAAMFVGCSDSSANAQPVPGRPAQGPAPTGPAAIPILYIRHCTACHGAQGHGDGPAAEFLFPKPRSFQDSPLRFAATGGNDEEVLKAIERTIHLGVPRSAMPGFGAVLGEPEIAGLARYVNDLGKTAAAASADSASRLPLPEGVPAAPRFDAAMVERGSVLYRSLACVSCHGPEGHGDGEGNKGLVDSLGKPVRPADLASGIYKSGSRPEDLYRTIIEGVPGTPMAAYGMLLIEDRGRGPKNDSSVWALVAYIQSLAPPRLRGQASGAEIPFQPGDEAMLNDPTHQGWLRVEPTLISMRPLWFRVEDNVALNVSIVRTPDHVALRLSWDDPTCDVNLDSGRFPDCVAIMFAMGSEVPALPMGVNVEGHAASAGPAVNIWNWKANRQFDASTGERHDGDNPRILPDGNFHLFGPPVAAKIAAAAPADVDQDLRRGEDLYRTAVAVGNVHSDPALVSRAALEANAEGFGTLTYQSASQQDISSTALWSNGRWFVTLYHDATPTSDLDISFQPGKRIPVAFAVWNGAKGDRNGIKLVSGWHWIVVPPATAPSK